MKLQTIFLIVDAILFIFLIIYLFKNHKREMKLLETMNFFQGITGEGPLNEEDGIIIPLSFEQDYDKSIGLFKAFKKDNEFYREEVAKILAKELLKNKAVKIEFIEGEKKDTIKASLKYVLEF